jgi:hypothetical protein
MERVGQVLVGGVELGARPGRGMRLPALPAQRRAGSPRAFKGTQLHRRRAAGRPVRRCSMSSGPRGRQHRRCHPGGAGVRAPRAGRRRADSAGAQGRRSAARQGCAAAATRGAGRLHASRSQQCRSATAAQQCKRPPKSHACTAATQAQVAACPRSRTTSNRVAGPTQARRAAATTRARALPTGTRRQPRTSAAPTTPRTLRQRRSCTPRHTLQGGPPTALTPTARRGPEQPRRQH